MRNLKCWNFSSKLYLIFRCRLNWKSDFGSGRPRVTWATVNDGVRCSTKAARSHRYLFWTNPVPKSSRTPNHMPLRPITCLQSENLETGPADELLFFVLRSSCCAQTTPQSLVVGGSVYPELWDLWTCCARSQLHPTHVYSTFRFPPRHQSLQCC